jgi:hypothetical protein
LHRHYSNPSLSAHWQLAMDAGSEFFGVRTREPRRI